MSNTKQCPSTVDTKSPDAGEHRLPLNASTGKTYWRGLEELANTPEFQERLQREFPAFASELMNGSRRTFMKLMGASFALAGVSALPGCRRPDHKILAYTKSPEDVIQGKATYYATAVPTPNGGAEGLLAETFTGRPTKLEGNPLHPINRGRSTIHSQAEILNLYDPDRLIPASKKGPNGRQAVSWRDFENFAPDHFARFDATRGRGLAFLVEKTESPSRDSMRDRIRSRWPEARWLPYEAIDSDARRQGSQIAFGAMQREIPDLSKAKVILSIDSDFLGTDPVCMGPAGSRTFSAGRRLTATQGPGSEMNRLYVVESMISSTGGSADHQLSLAPSEVSAFFAELCRSVLRQLGGTANTRIASALGRFEGSMAEHRDAAHWIEAISEDLLAHRGECVILVGESQPPAIHALAHALNAELGNAGQTISYAPLAEDLSASSIASIRQVAADIADGSLDTLVVIGGNPCFDAPIDLDFPALYSRIPTTIHLALHENETGIASTWRLNRTHFLEDWGDVVAADGTVSPIQPMIAPLAYEVGGGEPGKSDLALLAIVAGDSTHDSYELVRRSWQEGPLADVTDFEATWRRSLHDGLVGGTGARGRAVRINTSDVERACANITASQGANLELVFQPCSKVHDGRYSNNGWLQELPDAVTKLTWDNALFINPSKAKELGLTDGDIVEVSVSGFSLDIPVWRVPGVAQNAVVVTLGYGRTQSGHVGTGVGFNTYAIRTSDAMEVAIGASVSKVGGSHDFACTQTHWSMEGRDIILEFDLPAWHKHGDKATEDLDHYGRQRRLNFAEKYDTISHAPAIESLYGSVITENQTHRYDTRPQWGMSIDLTMCNGCGVCTIACQAENNIPVVGKREVAKGREMHWIRVDRYFGSADDPGKGEFSNTYGDAGPYTGGRVSGAVDMTTMPVPCMQCENAPCETVCPVNATIHDEEGLNVMAYNRCIGTRYCSNNCPYKVRRFNYFDYATKKLGGEFVGKEVLGGIVKSEHWVPPRLRERIDEGAGELRTMQSNPDVTVRERGVMEKCTYCVQRINAARVESKLQDLDHIPDGFFQVACQQACPSEAIVFGDLLDPESEVRKEHDSGLSYGLLAVINTRPRTRYKARVRNPNPKIRPPVVDPFEHHGGHNGHHDDHGGHGEESHDDGHVMSLPILTETRSALAQAASGVLGGLA